jgi:hypothetical protein
MSRNDPGGWWLLQDSTKGSPDKGITDLLQLQRQLIQLTCCCDIVSFCVIVCVMSVLVHRTLR